MPRNVCFVSAEVTPLAKTGGLGDVSAALAKYLYANDYDVRLFVPGYSLIDRSQLETRPVQALHDLPLEVGSHRYRFSVTAARLPRNHLTVHLIECPPLYDRPGIYTTAADEHLRFLALTRAAFECCRRMDWSPDILHCNDWHAGFGPLFLRAQYRTEGRFHRTRSVLTIHNVGYQGIFGAEAVADLGLGDQGFLLHQDDLRAGVINSMKHGILYADAITTVSPTHAREIRTARYGMGLQDVLQARGDALVGILNGVDYEEWDPRHDRFLPLHYGPDDPGGKARLKSDFLARLGLRAEAGIPLAGLVSRMTVQKGLDLLFDTLPPLLAQARLSFVALGNGDAHYERFFAGLQETFPGRAYFHRGYSDELAHWIEAASDMFLMPSLYEPCGLNQMYSLRYGTVPIVRRTGGLADSVEHYDPQTGRGTGIVFNDFDAPAMSWALNTALELYAQPEHWARMMRNGMSRDFSWQHQGAEYARLYERLLTSV